MKRLIVYILFLLAAGSICAQTRIWSNALEGGKKPKEKQLSASGLRTTQYDGVHHLLGISADGAYSMMMTNMPNVHNNPGGYSVGAGIHYSYLNGRLLVQTGLDFRWQDVKNTVDDVSYERTDVVDTWNLPFALTYTTTERMDCSRNFYLQVPLQVGIFMAGGCYLLVGPKLGVQLLGNTGVSNLTTTTARYDNRYIGLFEEMDNHGIRKEVPLSVSHEKLDLKIDLMAAIELGYEFAMSNKGAKSYRKDDMEDYRIRIAGFVDVGMLNICPHSQEKFYDFPDATRYDFGTFDFHHVFSTPQTEGYSLNNLFTGIRVSFFFYGYQSMEKCILCGSRGIQRKYHK